MIVRLVQLTIDPTRINDFLQLFEASKKQIRQSPGCLELTLVQDIDQPNRISTLSKWSDEDALQMYRESDFFRSTWSASKRMFADRASATSYQVISRTD